MGTDCKSAAFSFGGSNPPAPTKKSSVVITLDFCFTWNLEFHYLGWIRTAAEPTAACGGNREARLGPRPAGCERQRSRRWEPQPGFLIISAACVIHPARLGNHTALHRLPAHNRRNAFYSCISRMTPYEKSAPASETIRSGGVVMFMQLWATFAVRPSSSARSGWSSGRSLFGASWSAGSFSAASASSGPRWRAD